MISKRTGANSKDTIDRSVLQQLDAGVVETATLAEALAVDFSILMARTFPDVEAEAIAQMKRAQGLGITKRMKLAASLLSMHFDDEAFNVLRGHPSDTVRGWAAFALGLDADLSLQEKLEQIRELADDTHFGVREWAWLALRPAISQEIEKSIGFLVPWAKDTSENVRRFAVESTRPRGVWSTHIPELKTSPAIGEPLLDPVMGDASRYVQNSCANWLNDAAKDNVGWVVGYCEKWRTRSPSEAVSYITRRALRSVA